LAGITKDSTLKCWGGHVEAAMSPPPGEFVQVQDIIGLREAQLLVPSFDWARDFSLMRG
jgi:hypothetical protein